MWGLVAIMTVLLTLAIAILSTIIFNSHRIRGSERKFRLLFNRVFDGILLLDINRRIVDANDSACKLFSSTKDELLSLDINALLVKEEFQYLNSKLTKIFANSLDFVGEFRFNNKNGKITSVEAGCTLLEINGEKFVLMSMHDMTLHRQIEFDLKNKNLALKQVLAHIEDEKRAFRTRIGAKAQNILIPALNKISIQEGSINPIYLDIIKSELQQMAKFDDSKLLENTNFTPRELEVINLLRSGVTSKEIAETLHLSTATVQKHREKIRHKLKLSNRSISLSDFIRKPTEQE